MGDQPLVNDKVLLAVVTGCHKSLITLFHTFFPCLLFTYCTILYHFLFVNLNNHRDFPGQGTKPGNNPNSENAENTILEAKINSHRMLHVADNQCKVLQ